jgi:hypothetical protein
MVYFKNNKYDFLLSLNICKHEVCMKIMYIEESGDHSLQQKVIGLKNKQQSLYSTM